MIVWHVVPQNRVLSITSTLLWVAKPSTSRLTEVSTRKLTTICRVRATLRATTGSAAAGRAGGGTMAAVRRPSGGVRWVIAALLSVLALTAAVELGMGRLPFGPDGRFGWWDGDIWSRENSQRVADAYSFSHLVHGILFF